MWKQTHEDLTEQNLLDGINPDNINATLVDLTNFFFYLLCHPFILIYDSIIITLSVSTRTTKVMKTPKILSISLVVGETHTKHIALSTLISHLPVPTLQSF